MSKKSKSKKVNVEAPDLLIGNNVIIEESISRGIGSFTPDLLFEQLVKNYKNVKEIYGETIIRALTGYDESYTQKNIKIPEFQREIKKNIEEGIKHLKKSNLLDKQGIITSKATELATLVLYVEELDDILPKGSFGEYEHTRTAHYGTPFDITRFKKGHRYRDIALKKSVKTALRRGHSTLSVEDLKVYERHARGQTSIIYAVDASGSMKGTKIQAAKKAGIALAYRAIERNDEVGVIVFKDQIEEEVPPTKDFGRLLQEIVKIRASGETDMEKTIRKSIDLFPHSNITKHLLLLTDALPTKGSTPRRSTLEAVSEAREAGITISVIGVRLDKEGEEFAQKIVEIGNGRFYQVRNEADMKVIVLEEYNALM